MKNKASITIVQRKRLADKASLAAQQAYRHRIRLLPPVTLLAVVAALVLLRLRPGASKTVSHLIEASSGQVSRLSILWSPVSVLSALSVAAVLYMWMDYQHHRVPLIRIAPKVKYGLLHHLKVVFLPRFHYRWRPAFYWLATAEVCAAVFIATVAIVGVPSAKAFSGDGLGTDADHPYIITSCAQLQEMRDDLDGYYELAGPIDCTATSTWNSGAGFEPVATQFNNPFTGSLNGKGFTIDGLTQVNTNGDDGGAVVGIFGVVSGGTLTDFKLTNVDFSASGEGFAAASVAGAILNTTLSDITIDGVVAVNTEEDSSFAGGIALQAVDSTLLRLNANLVITHNVLAPDDEKPSISSALFGYIMNTTLTDSYATGSITANVSNGDGSGDNIMMAGLVGQAYAGSIQNSYSSMSLQVNASGDLQDNVMIMGGIAIVGSGVQVNHSFATGTQTIVGDFGIKHQGVILGAAIYLPDDENYDTNISGTDNYGDASRTGISACIGTYIDESFREDYGNTQTPNGFCSSVNVGNSQPNYFFNNHTNPPLNSWNFTNVWKTQTTSTPIFGTQVPGVPAVPGKPRNVTTSSTNTTSLTAQWLVPVSNGNSPITNYAMQYKLHSAGTWTAVTRSPSTATSQLITGLSAGVQYDLRVAAINAVGQGDWQVTENVTTSQLPSAVQNFNITGVQGTQEFGDFEDFYFPRLNWGTPAVGAPITDYVIQYKVHRGPDWDDLEDDFQNAGMPWVSEDWVTVDDGAGTVLNFNSMANADPYLVQALILSAPLEAHAIDTVDFRIAAVNSHGQGPWTSTQNFQVFVGLTECQQMHDKLVEYPMTLFQLMNNIDCTDTVNWNSGAGWAPIQDQNVPFTGTIEGDGHTISNLYINNQEKDGIAMIAYAENATFRNFTMSNVSIASWFHGDAATAAVVGYVTGDSVLSDISVTGTVKSLSLAGGVLGVYDSEGSTTATLSDLSFNGTLNAAEVAGGVAAAMGIIHDPSDEIGNVVAERLHSTGTIYAAGQAGGITALANGVRISDSSSTMDMTSSCESAAGLVGSSLGLTLVNSNYEGDITCTTDNLGYFNYGRAIAVNAQNEAFVIDTTDTGNVHKLSATGVPITEWSTARPGDVSDWRSVTGVAVDGQGRVFVTDEANSQVRIFSGSGQFIDAWSTPSPGKLTITGSNVYVVSGDTVRKYNLEGDLLGSYNGGGTFSNYLRDVAVASDGRIYASDEIERVVHVMASNGDPITDIAIPSGFGSVNQPVSAITLDANDNLIVATGVPRVYVFDSSYQEVSWWVPGATDAYDVAYRADGDLYVLSRSVKQFRGQGQLINQWGGTKTWTSSGYHGMIAGGLVGAHSPYMNGALTIQNSTATGQIATSKASIVILGGLVGTGVPNNALTINSSNPEQEFSKGVAITDSSSAVDIATLGTIAIAGGLVGSSQVVDIAGSSAAGSIAVGDGTDVVDGQTGGSGGLVGINEGAARIRNSHASGSVGIQVVIPKDKYLQGAYAGGLVGRLAGWTKLENSYATGNVTVGLNTQCQPEQCDPSFMRTGGLVGDITHTQNIAASLKITDVYATGQVNYNGQASTAVVGGLIGFMQVHQMELHDAYATGNVVVSASDTSALLGGLIGALSTDTSQTFQDLHATGNIMSTARAPFVQGYGLPAATGGLIGALIGPITVQKSYATGDVQGVFNVGGLIGMATTFDYSNDHKPENTRTIKDTYATGNVTGYNVIASFDENSEFGEGLFEMGTSAGGLIGSMVSTNVLSSYASGVLTNQKPEFAEDVPEFYAGAAYGAASGGLVGLASALPIAGAQPDDLTTISNSFSAVTMQDTTANPKGALVGKYFSWLYGAFDENEPVHDLKNLLINNYNDVSKSGPLDCANDQILQLDEQNEENSTVSTESFNDTGACKTVNASNQTPNYFINNTTNPPLSTWDFTAPIWYSHATTYPTFAVGESPPGPPRNLVGVPTTSSVALSWDAPSSDGGSPVVNYRIQYRLHGTTDWADHSHPESTATNYVISGLTSGARYDFQVSALNAVGQSSWVLGIYDVLVPGEPSNPTNPNNPSSPTTPTRPTRPTTGARTTPPVASSNPSDDVVDQRGGNLLDVTGDPEYLPPVFSTAAPTKRVNPIPYFFLSWLLLLALYFVYRAYKEYRYQKAVTALILQAATTEKSVSDFLAITTHYLGTPLSILKGAIELIASKHALQAEFMTAFQKKLTALQVTSDSLTLQNEQALNAGQPVVAGEVASVNSNKQLWIPLAGIAVLVAITDIVLMLSKSYDQPWGRTLNHGIWAVFGTLAVVVGYYAWSKQKKLHAAQRQTLARQRDLLTQKNAFLGEAAQQLTTHASQLRQGTAGLEQFPDTKLLMNGLGMLDKVANALGKVQRFSIINDSSPSLNVQQIFARDIAPQLTQEAEAHGVAIRNMLGSDVNIQMQPEELQQVLSTTVQNAIQFSTSGSSVVVGSEAGSRKATLIVQDEGQGISLEAQQHLFEPLTRGVDTATFDHEGLGLNLFITRMILQKHGGDIRLVSKPQQGTMVKMTLPNSGSVATGVTSQVISPSTSI